MAETRESLRRRPDVAEADIDDIIEIAAELQQVERDRAPVATVKEVEAVAVDLDIDPAYVQQAIEALHGRRAEAAAAQARAAAARANTRRQLGYVGVAALGVVALFAVALAGLGAMGASNLDAADVDVAHAEQQLAVVLDRQAQLVPQLAGLAGADTAGLPEVPRSGPMEDRLAASDSLAHAMTASLSSMPADASNEQIRLNLQHELAGAANRISVERGRWDAARAEREAVAHTLTGGIAEILFR